MVTPSRKDYVALHEELAISALGLIRCITVHLEFR